jgi:pimeloyl-ACP methyl ester carboxylesterase
METASTTENRSVEIDGATLVYRRLGDDRSDAPVLLCLQHFRGSLDNWDPALVDRLAADREVVLLADRGVGASTGVVPDNVEDMAATSCASSTCSRSAGRVRAFLNGG